MKNKIMTTFSDVQIGQTFYTTNGKPSKKISNTKAVSMVVEYCGVDFQDVMHNVTFTQYPNAHVYGVGENLQY